MILIQHTYPVTNPDVVRDGFNMAVETLLMHLAAGLSVGHRYCFDSFPMRAKAAGESEDTVPNLVLRRVILEIPTVVQAATLIQQLYERGVCGVSLHLKTNAQYHEMMAELSGKDVFLGAHFAGVYAVWIGADEEHAVLLQRAELDHSLDES